MATQMGRGLATDVGNQIRSRPVNAWRFVGQAWCRVDRLAAWFLLPLLALQFLSGYAMLHWQLFAGIVARPTAFRIHGLIQPITVAAFVIHGGGAVRRALMKRRIRSRLVDVGLVSIGAGMIAFAVYLYFTG